MRIKKRILSADKWRLKCPHHLEPIGVCIHNTATSASAKDEIRYMHRNDSPVSYHYAVDEKEAIQGLPLDKNAWHAGDGFYGTGNRKYLSIEICRSTADYPLFLRAQANAAKLVARLLFERNLDTASVKKHCDFRATSCPHRTLEYGWDKFIGDIQRELDDLKQRGEEVEYKTFSDVPAWGKPTVKKLIDKGALQGSGKGDIDLPHSMLRTFVILDRLGKL